MSISENNHLGITTAAHSELSLKFGYDNRIEKKI